MRLQQQLLGTWLLKSYAEHRDAEEPHYPLGEAAQGMLIYSPDGYMSAMLMRTGRAPFATNDWFRPTDGELAEASAFIAYNGTFSIDEPSGTVEHRISLSYFPNWIGQKQVRLVVNAADDLILTPAAPIMSAGTLVVPTLHWRRAPIYPGADKAIAWPNR